jgi:hypothetical protein
MRLRSLSCNPKEVFVCVVVQVLIDGFRVLEFEGLEFEGLKFQRLDVLKFKFDLFEVIKSTSVR